MKKIKFKSKILSIVFILGLCLFANATVAQRKSAEGQEIPKPNIDLLNQEFNEGKYVVKIFKLETEGFGYQILNRNKTLILQESKSFFTIPLTKLQNAKAIALWHINNIVPNKDGKIQFDTQKALQLGVSPSELKSTNPNNH